jgi:hypothetical protein
MVSSGMLRRVAVVRTDVSEEPRASVIRVTRIGELRTTLAVTTVEGLLSNQVSDLRGQLKICKGRNQEGSVMTAVAPRNTNFFAACVGC